MSGSGPGGFEVGDAAYSARIFDGGSHLTRWSHRRRADTAGGILSGRRYDRVVDVGGADGWFLRSLVAEGTAARGTVIDIDPDLLDHGRSQCGDESPIDFVLNDEASLGELRGAFDLAVCMETLEHVPDPAESLDEVMTLVRPGGEVLVTVPVEVGPALVGKQLGRWLANRRGTYIYERYSASDLAQAALRWDVGGIERDNLHSHKGFDYRQVRALLEARTTLVRTQWSPIRLFGPAAASTVSWLGRAPASA